MLHITNQSLVYDLETEQDYCVFLNGIPLVRFKHYAPDGMVECFFKAAQALDGIDIDRRIVQHEVAMYENLRVLAKRMNDGKGR